MNNNSKSLFLILLLVFSILPTSVSAGDSGRNAYSVSLSSYEVGTGETVEIEAYVTGYQYYDNQKTTGYNIRAESSTGETYAIATNLDDDAEEGVITYSWMVPQSIPTGYYQICVEESDSELGSPMCRGLNVIRYQIDLEVNNEVLLPGDTLVVWATVSSPVDGSPETPDTAGWTITYETRGTETTMWGDIITETQRKSGILTPDSQNQFGVLLPSNLDPGSSLEITFYANDSSGSQQFSEVGRVIQIGHLLVEISMPSYDEVISINSDFVLQINCKRTPNQWSWESMPAANLPLTVKLEQGEYETPVSVSSNLPGQSSDIVCDSNGFVSLLLTADDVNLKAGSAKIVVYWTDAASSEEASTSQPIYLSEDGSEPLNGVGIELAIDGPSTSSKPGEEIRLTINTYDLAGNPLPGIWVHHHTIRTSDGGIDDRSEWNIQQSDDQGELIVLMTIPEEMRAGANSISLFVSAKNETGSSDYTEHEIRVIDPEINIYPDTANWLPGDDVVMRIDAKDMTGDVVVFWSVYDLEIDGQFKFAADSQGGFSFTVPERESQDFSSLDIGVMVIDSSGQTDSDNYRLYRLNGFSMMVTPPNEVLIAGETVAISYVLSTMDPTVPIEYPIQWTGNIMGVADSGMLGIVSDASGSIEYTVPSYLVSGSYLLGINFGGVTTYIPVEIRSDDDATGVSGSFSSVADSLDSASGWVSTLALILALACLGLLLKRGGKKDEEWSSFNEPLPIANPTATLIPPPPLPPAGIPEYDPTSPTGYAQPPRY